MADAVDATEPATSPRMMEVPVQRWVEELRLPTRETGPREEPEPFASRMILNDGQWTEAEHEALLRKAAQAFNYRDMNRELEDAVQREKEAHEWSIQEWEARIALQDLTDHPEIPRGPPPKETSSMRVLPNVHAALRQNDPLWLQGRSQSSRKLRHLWEGRCQKVSTLTRNLQGLVHQCSLHHRRLHVQEQLSLKVYLFHWQLLR